MVAVMIVTFVVYLPVLENGFVNWDDHRVLLGHDSYRGFAWRQIQWMFVTRHMCHFQPLTWASYALNCTLWGMDPWGFHLTSLLFHVAAAGMFFWVARHLLHRGMGGKGRALGVGLSLAAGLAALLFAVHPLRVESVAWASERRDVTSGLFFMITLAGYLRASARAGRAKMGWLAASLVAYVLSLMGKAIGMTLPVVLVALDVYPLRRLGWLGGSRPGALARGVWLEKLPYLVIAVVAAVIAILAQYQDAPLASIQGVPWLARIAIAFYGTAFYLHKTLVPLALSPLYPPDGPFDPLALHFVLSGVAVVLISIGAIVAARRWPAGIIAWITYLVILSPVVGLVQIGPQIAADRYTYLSCLAWAILLAAGWLAVWRRRRTGPGWQTAFAAASVLLPAGMVGLGWLTRRQITVWHDSGTLWRQAIRVLPHNGIAHGKLAHWLGQQGRLDDALDHHRKTVELQPHKAAGHANMGVTLSRLGRRDEAATAFRQALEKDPHCFVAHNGLGMILASARDPDQVKAGIEHLEEAVRLRPTYTTVRLRLADHCARTGRHARAAAVLRAGLELAPHHATFSAMLAWLLATCPDPAGRNGAEALVLARQACERTGHSDPDLLDVLAAALAEVGRFDQAVKVAQDAVVLARQARRKTIALEIEQRIRAYQARRPWRAGQ